LRRHAFTSGGYDPTLEFAWAQSLPRGFSLSGNVTAAPDWFISAGISLRGFLTRKH
jgi:hypothetical protein